MHSVEALSALFNDSVVFKRIKDYNGYPQYDVYTTLEDTSDLAFKVIIFDDYYNIKTSLSCEHAFKDVMFNCATEFGFPVISFIRSQQGFGKVSMLRNFSFGSTIMNFNINIVPDIKKSGFLKGLFR